MKKLILNFIIFLSLATVSKAQKIAEPTWVASVEQKVRKIHSTQLNIPIIETVAQKLFGLEPLSGEILWKYQMKTKLNSLKPIAGTPFSILNNSVLLDINDGRSLDLSQLITGKVRSYHLVPESYDLVFYSTGPDDFLVIDLFNLEVRWKMKSDFSDSPSQTTASNSEKLAAAMNNNQKPKEKKKVKGKFGAGLAAMAEEAMATESAGTHLECPPVSNKAGGIIIASLGKLVNIDDKGNVLWLIEQPKFVNARGKTRDTGGISEIIVDQQIDQFYVLKWKMITALKITDGSVTWPDFYSFKGSFILEVGAGLMPMSYGPGALIGGGKPNLNLIDRLTGKPIWTAPLEPKGGIKRYKILPNGNLAIISDRAINDYFQIVDVAKGKFKYPEPIKLKGSIENYIIGKEKIIFLTDRGIDLIDRASGSDLLSRMQKFKGDAKIHTIFKGSLVYNIDTENKKVYKTDLKNDFSEKILNSYKFQVNEDLLKYDVLDNGNLFLASEHHMKTYSPVGDLLVDVPFDYAGRGLDKFERALEVTEAVSVVTTSPARFALAATELGIEAVTQGAIESTYPSLAVNKVYKNQKAAEKFVALQRIKKDETNTSGSFFVTRNKELKANFLSYVSKKDGKTIFEVGLAEDAENPEYVVEESTGFVYYAPSFNLDDTWKGVFNKGKAGAARANDNLGLVVGYEMK